MKKEMARILAVMLLGIFLLSLLTITVSAADVKDTTKKLTSGISDFIQGIQETITGRLDEIQFIRVLFFVLVFLIIVAILGVIPLFQEQKGIKILVALIVTILSVMFIPVELIKPMLNPYSALGVALISIIPFALMFVFTQYMLVNTFLKKVAWMFFAVYLLGMTVYTSISIDMTKGVTSMTVYTWVYGLASVLALLMVFFNDWIDKHIWSGKMDAKMTAAQKRMQKRIALDTLKEEEAAAQGL